MNAQTVAIIGLGRSGVAAARFLAARGIPVLACDDHPSPALAGELRAPVPGGADIELRLGGEWVADVAQCQQVLLSPGIPRTHKAVQAALVAGKPVINDVEWLYRVVRAESGPNPQFMGITGTNGKSTVTTLAGMMAQGSTIPCQVGGNLGDAALTLWDAAARLYVLELSSYQLESVEQFHANVAVLLNVTPDHLDRYHNLGAYLEAKKRVFRHMGAGDVAVLNADDAVIFAPLQRELVTRSVRVIPFSIRSAPQGGVYVQNGVLIDHRGAHPEPILDLSHMVMAGRHNQANAAAAAAAALSAGATPEAVEATLRRFPGLPHRMEWVRTLDEVRYFNDSKGTNVGAVVESLQSFPDKVVLIAGGRDKAGDFAPLAKLLRKRVEAVVLIGEAAPTMRTAFSGLTRLVEANSMNEAVAKARRLAPPGGVVLLSPACASFDMFKNFEDRGRCFREAVYGL